MSAPILGIVFALIAENPVRTKKFRTEKLSKDAQGEVAPQLQFSGLARTESACFVRRALSYLLNVQIGQPHKLVLTAARKILGVGLLFCFLLGLAAAVDSDLHQRIHSNASDPGHHCFVTLLSSGQLSLTDSVGLLVCVVLGLAFARVPQLLCRPVISFLLLPPGRAPPLVSSPR